MSKTTTELISTLALVSLLTACGGSSGDVAPATGVTSGKAASTSASTPATEAVAPAIPSPTTQSAAPAARETRSRAEVSAPSDPTTSRKTVSVPDFALVAYQGHDVLGGHETQFSRVFEQGQPVVLNFWAGNCPPCRFEMPSFQEAAEKYEGRVVFVGVDVGVFTGLGDQQSARQLLDELEIRYPSAYAVDISPLQQYKILNMPTTIFFDSHGREVTRRTGIATEDDLREMVERLVTGP